MSALAVQDHDLLGPKQLAADLGDANRGPSGTTIAGCSDWPHAKPVLPATVVAIDFNLSLVIEADGVSNYVEIAISIDVAIKKPVVVGAIVIPTSFTASK